MPLNVFFIPGAGDIDHHLDRDVDNHGFFSTDAIVLMWFAKIAITVKALRLRGSQALGVPRVVLGHEMCISFFHAADRSGGRSGRQPFCIGNLLDVNNF